MILGPNNSYFIVPLISQIPWISQSILFLAGMISSGFLFLTFRYIRKRKYLSLSRHTQSIFNESDPLNTLINNLPDSVFIKDTSGKYIVANESFVQLLHADNPDGVLGKTDADIYQSDICDKYVQEDQRLLQGDIPMLKRREESAGKDKQKITVTTKLPLRNKREKIIGILGICTDVTESEIASKQLHEKNKILEKERSLFRALMDNMPDTIYIKDTECRFLDGNPHQVKVTKAGSHKNLMGKTDFDFYPKDVAEIFYKDDKKVIETGEPVINKEEIGFDPEGNIRVKSTTKVPFTDAEGKIIGLVGIGRDITRQKEAEEKLKEQANHLQEINVLLEERQEEIRQQSDELGMQNKKLEEERNLLRTLIDNIPDYIYVKDSKCRFVTVNKQMMRAFKTDDLDKIIGKSDTDFYPDEYASVFLKDDKEVIKSGKPIIHKEEPGVNAKGNLIQLLTSKVPFYGPDGEILGIIGIARDITNIKEAELKLQEQADNLKDANVLLEERQEEIQQQSQELSAQNTILENERNLLRTLIDAIPDVIYIKDKESRFISANKQILDVMKARSLKNLEGKTDFDFYPKEMASGYYEDERKVIESGKPLINKLEIGFDKKGNQRTISTTKVPFFDSDGNVAGIVGVGRDITDLANYQQKLKDQALDLKDKNNLLEERQEEIQKQSEYLTDQNLALEKERNLLRTLIDNMPDYIYIKDKECRFLTVNLKLLKVMHAKSLDDIVGKTDYDTAPNKESADTYHKDDMEIIKTGKAIINKEEVGFDEKDRERVISTTKVPYYDADGNIAGIVGIGRDITKQKKSEKQLREQAQNLQEVNVILEERQEKIQQQTEELNRQAQNLKKANNELEQLNTTKNKFFSIIAHDLKNPFQAIFGFSELLMRNYNDFDEPQKMELLAMIKSSSESAFNLLENLLQWARTQTDRIKYNPDYFMLAEIIDQNIELSKASAENKQITLLSQIDCDSSVFADQNMINLVVRNLISNAVKFTEEKGVVTVGCEMKGKDHVRVYIADTGVGISEQNIKKLFRIDEYFSTSGTAGEGGTGLGLIICKEFIQKNKGKLEIESKLGEGTTFTFLLPVKETT